MQDDESASLDTNRPLYYAEYDNLNQIVSLGQYDGDDYVISYADGIPDAPSSSLLRSKTSTAFDERGREYLIVVYDVDPTDGSVGAYELTTYTWYDRRGNVIKTLQPGGLVTKFAYDGMGRLIMTYYSDGGGDALLGDTDNWLDATDVDLTDDTVYEQTEYLYDEVGNVITTINKKRLPTADSTTGPLGDAITEPLTRVAFNGMYYDRANRLIGSVDVGDYGGDPWTWDGEVPTRTDTALVSSYEYDDAGNVTSTFDPRNIESRTSYDALGRVTRTIEGYEDGVVSSHDDRITDYEYDGSNHVVTKILLRTTTASATTCTSALDTTTESKRE